MKLLEGWTWASTVVTGACISLEKLKINVDTELLRTFALGVRPWLEERS